MSLKKHLLLFLLKFAMVYAILLLPPFRSMYADAFNATGNKWFKYVGEKGVAIFRANETGIDPVIVSEIRLFNKQRVAEANSKGIKIFNDYGRVRCNWYGYLLIAYLLALIAATPISWKRKLISSFVGLLITYFYFLLMLWVLLVYKFSQNTQLDVIQLKGFDKKTIDVLYPVVVGNPGTTVFVALIIYGLVVFRKQDIEKLKAALSSSN